MTTNKISLSVTQKLASGYVWTTAQYPVSSRGLLSAITYILDNEQNEDGDTYELQLDMMGCTLKIDLDELVTNRGMLTLTNQDGSVSRTSIDDLARVAAVLS